MSWFHLRPMFVRVFGLQLFIVLLLVAPLTRAAPLAYQHLQPGAPADLQEQVPVNFVFVGYEPTNIDAAAFLSALPQTYKPVVRSRLLYGITEYVGLTYTYNYNVVFADEAYETNFFLYLTTIGQPAALTSYQVDYNNQQRNVLDVTANHYIDAPSVERWLATHPPAGVDTARNTVFFINWWGNGTTPRGSFKHHVYTKFGEPDPDTGYDFGINTDSRKIIAWGGTTADDEETGLGSTYRVWFYDLSAGPESWTSNWNVDNRSVVGGPGEEYRMPPIWEYFAPNGYRSASKLTSDLAKVARYVAINLLFTPSPIYPPGFTPQRIPNTINLDITTFESIPGVIASEQYIKPEYIRDEISEVHRVTYTVDQQVVDLQGRTKTCVVIFTTRALCYPAYTQYPSNVLWNASLFLHNALNIEDLRDGGGEYEAPILNYAIEEQYLQAPFLGLADENYIDGTQSFAYNFVSPLIVEAGYGLSTTNIHEYGHHLNLSHPHDGYDYEQGRDYGPRGDLYFAWSGDQVNSIMSYIDLNWDFSQFDRDNNNRFQAAAYVTNANAIAAAILADPDAALAAADLANADVHLGLAKQRLAAHDYDGLFDNAKLAYEAVVSGAAKAGVPVNASDRGVYVEPPAGRPPANTEPFGGAIDLLTPDNPRTQP